MHQLFKDFFYDKLMSIDPTDIGSHIDEAFGFTEEDYITLVKNKLSLQSWRIQSGNYVEASMNSLFSYLGINLIEDEIVVVGKYKSGKRKGQDKIKVIKKNLVKVNGKNRQVDHHIRIKRKDGVWNLYLESKCSVEFDTEKKIKSNDKISEVMFALGADEGAYFIPVLKTIPKEISSKYPNVKIYGLQDILDMIEDCPITCDEIFDGYKEFKNEWFAKLKSKNV